MGYSGSKKTGSGSPNSSGEPASRAKEFFSRPLVTVTLGAVIGLAVIAGSIWLLSASGSPSNTPADGNAAAAGDSEASQETTPVPRAELDTEAIEFGRLTQDDVAKQIITVTNTGDELLVIRDVDAT